LNQLITATLSGHADGWSKNASDTSKIH